MEGDTPLNLDLGFLSISLNFQRQFYIISRLWSYWRSPELLLSFPQSLADSPSEHSVKFPGSLAVQLRSPLYRSDTTVRPTVQPVAVCDQKVGLAAQMEDMVTTKEQQVDLMQSLWWMKYHEMSSWSHLAYARSQSEFNINNRAMVYHVLFLLYNGSSTSQQRGNIVLFIGLLHWWNTFGTLYRTR